MLATMQLIGRGRERDGAAAMSRAIITVPTPVRVVALTQTTKRHPSQFEGWTEYGIGVYIRYRWDELTVALIADDFSPPRQIFRSKRKTKTHDESGVMTYDQVRARMPDWIVLPDRLVSRSTVERPTMRLVPS
jgi:hypothetical protein